jgi:hypothetical protein
MDRLRSGTAELKAALIETAEERYGRVTPRAAGVARRTFKLDL